MVIRDARALLAITVEETLAELVGDEQIDVTYDLSVLSRNVYQAAPEEAEEDYYVVETMHWHLNLFVILRHRGRFLNLGGEVAYEGCRDGNPMPMQLLVRRLWQEQQFGALMADEDFEADLEKVVAEHEGGR